MITIINRKINGNHTNKQIHQISVDKNQIEKEKRQREKSENQICPWSEKEFLDPKSVESHNKNSNIQECLRSIRCLVRR